MSSLSLMDKTDLLASSATTKMPRVDRKGKRTVCAMTL